jgi:hypothetical protein
MSVVPLIPLRQVDDLADRIEQLMGDAEGRRYCTLAYFLHMALIEARIHKSRKSTILGPRKVNWIF